MVVVVVPAGLYTKIARYYNKAKVVVVVRKKKVNDPVEAYLDCVKIGEYDAVSDGKRRDQYFRQKVGDVTFWQLCPFYSAELVDVNGLKVPNVTGVYLYPVEDDVEKGTCAFFLPALNTVALELFCEEGIYESGIRLKKLDERLTGALVLKVEGGSVKLAAIPSRVCSIATLLALTVCPEEVGYEGYKGIISERGVAKWGLEEVLEWDVHAEVGTPKNVFFEDVTDRVDEDVRVAFGEKVLAETLSRNFLAAIKSAESVSEMSTCTGYYSEKIEIQEPNPLFWSKELYQSMLENSIVIVSKRHGEDDVISKRYGRLFAPKGDDCFQKAAEAVKGRAELEVVKNAVVRSMDEYLLVTNRAGTFHVKVLAYVREKFGPVPLTLESLKRVGAFLEKEGRVYVTEYGTKNLPKAGKGIPCVCSPHVRTDPMYYAGEELEGRMLTLYAHCQMRATYPLWYEAVFCPCVGYYEL